MKILNFKLKICLTILFFFLWYGQADAATLSKAPNNLGLVGYWSFDEATGTKVTDFSGHNINGSLCSGSCQWVSGKFGSAMYFPNTGPNSIAIGSTTDFQFGTNSFSVSFWAKIDPSSTNALPVSNASSGYSTIGFRFFINDSMYFYVGDGVNYVEDGVNIVAYKGQWTHFVGTWDVTDKKGRLYINGVLSKTTNANLNVGAVNSIRNLRFGGTSDYGYVYKGSLDDVRIYNRALSATEVIKLYKSSSAKPKTPNNFGLAGYWSFDEATGTKAMDYSGKNNNGSITGATWTNGKLGKALNFDGATNRVIVIDTFDPTAYTYSMWVKPEAIVAQNIFVRSDAGGPGSSYSHQLRMDSSGHFEHYTWDGGPNTVTGTTVAQPNNWYFVTVVATGGGGFGRLYVNGVEEGTADAIPGTLWSDGDRYWIGQSSSGHAFFDGTIDDIHFYNRALSATEVMNLYQSGAIKVNASQNVTGTSLDSSLVGMWSFDGKDISGTTVYDRSGGGVNGTISGATKTIGKVGQALKFNGTSDTVSLSASPTLVGNNFTLASWVKPELPQASGMVIYNGDDAAGYGIGVGATGDGSGSILFGLYGQVAWLDSGATLTNGRWTHIAMVRRDNTTYFYIDGVQDDTTFSSTPGFPTATKASIGFVYNTSNAPFRYYKGLVDEARVYNRALSATEIKQLYLMGK